MPDFFDLANLPPEKSDRYNFALSEFQRICDENIDREIRSMTKAEIDALLEAFPKKTFSAREALAVNRAVAHGGAGHPKSALFARLLDGKNPLAFPPPLYFGFPWYDIFDKAVVHEIHVKIDRASAIPRVSIGEHLWDEARQIDHGLWEVSTGDWAKSSQRMVWSLRQRKLDSSTCKAFIRSNSDPSIRRITTMSQLKREVNWHVEQRQAALLSVRNASPEELTIARDKSLHSQARADGLGTGRIKLLQQGLYLLHERRKKGMSGDVLNSGELEKERQLHLARYFKKNTAEGHFVVDGEGHLWRKSWSLERLGSEK